MLDFIFINSAVGYIGWFLLFLIFAVGIPFWFLMEEKLNLFLISLLFPISFIWKLIVVEGHYTDFAHSFTQEYVLIKDACLYLKSLDIPISEIEGGVCKANGQKNELNYVFEGKEIGLEYHTIIATEKFSKDQRKEFFIQYLKENNLH